MGEREAVNILGEGRNGLLEGFTDSEKQLCRDRASELGTSVDPECGACAEYIYCGTVHVEHTCERRHQTVPCVVTYVSEGADMVDNKRIEALERTIRAFFGGCLS